MPKGVRRLFFEFLYLTSIIRSLINKYIKYGRNYLFWNKSRLLIAKRGNIGMIHIIVCEDSDMFITR